MSNFNKLAARGGLSKDNGNSNPDDVQQCIIVRGIPIPIDELSHGLRQRWQHANRRITAHDTARDELKAIGEEALAEHIQNKAMKFCISQPVSGSHNVLKKLSGKK
jgi:hypothetical protein